MSTDDDPRTAAAERIQGLARGARGEQGRPGVPGVPRSVRVAMASLFVLVFAMSGANLLWSAHLVNENHAQRCTAVTAVARIRLLTGADKNNPSRVALNTIILSDRERARNLHCKGA